MAGRGCCVPGRGLDLATVLVGYIRDARDPAKVIHSYASMIDARIGAIACGHEDCDDLDVLREIAGGRCGAGLATTPVAAGECGRLAGAGPDGAAHDRSLLRQLRLPAASDRAGHR